MLDDEATSAEIEAVTERKEVADKGDLIALSYRSIPKVPFTSNDLKSLLEQARKNNAREQITGVIVMGRRHIYQWLEGPKDSVDKLMGQIITDPRHVDVKVLERRPISARLFDPWTMLLATDSSKNELPENTLSLPEDSFTESSENVSAPDSITTLADLARSSATFRPDNHLEVVYERTNRSAIGALSFDDQLRARLDNLEATRNREKWDLAASALTTLLLEDDFLKVEHFLRAMSKREADPLTLQVALLEQSERRLGDLWLEDLCSSIEINIALSEMIRAVRSVNFGTQRVWRVPVQQPDVLIVSQPGESHMLPAMLDAEVLWQHGWEPTLEFPKRDEDLQQLLADHWFEALDISMSGVFRRPERLRRLADTVELARDSSRNPKIAITVGGRAMYEDGSLLIELGADGLVTTASDVETVIQDAIQRRRVTD
ncbi:MAG: BLUF domain-containing protein [Pseudomonadota bacterium]